MTRALTESKWNDDEKCLKSMIKIMYHDYKTLTIRLDNIMKCNVVHSHNFIWMQKHNPKLPLKK